jgi:hypothetical protein
MFRVVQRRTMPHTDMGIAGATTDRCILFENGVRRNRLVLPGRITRRDGRALTKLVGRISDSVIRPLTLRHGGLRLRLNPPYEFQAALLRR